MIAAWIGAALVLAGAAALYLASPNQRLVFSPLPRRRIGWSGAVAIGAGLALLLQWAGPATAVFTAATLAMLVWSVVPPIAAWARRPKEDNR
jgi:uncharacterized membrane protein